MGFEDSKKEKVDPEVVYLAENLLQLHHAKTLTENSEPMTPTDEGSEESRKILTHKNIESGDGFRYWFNSPEGKAIMQDYVSKHTINQIGEFADMEELEELYLQFRNRTLH